MQDRITGAAAFTVLPHPPQMQRALQRQCRWAGTLGHISTLTSTASLLRSSALAALAPKRASRWLRRSALPAWQSGGVMQGHQSRQQLSLLIGIRQPTHQIS